MCRAKISSKTNTRCARLTLDVEAGAATAVTAIPTTWSAVSAVHFPAFLCGCAPGLVSLVSTGRH